MTVHNDLDHRLNAFLRDGPTELPYQSFDAVRDRMEDTPQRVVIGPWTFPEMNKILTIGLGAAAVVVLVFGGAALAAFGTRFGIGSEPTPPQGPSSDLGIFEPVAGRIVYYTPYPDSSVWAADPSAPADPATKVQLNSDAGTPVGWSRDGTRLLIMRESRGTEQLLFVLHADGSEKQVTEGPMAIRGAAISPDGSRIVFSGSPDGRSGPWALYAADADGGPAEILAESRIGILDDLSFSPDGTRIVYADGAGDSNHHVWVMDADGSDAHEILSRDCACHVYGLAWSPAGDRIAMGMEGTIYIFAPDGSGFTRVITGGDHPYWSPDGAQIAYTISCVEDGMGCGLAIADADGSNVVTLDSGASGPWHPAGSPGSPGDEPTAAAHFPVFPGPPRPVDAGIYNLGSDFLGPDFPVTISFVVPDGWLSCANNAGLLCSADGAGGVNIFNVTNVVADPCDQTTLRDPSVGPTVHDLVTAISSLPWSAVTPPTDVTVDGFRGTELEVTAPTRSPCVGTDDFATWTHVLTPERAAGVSPGERNRLRILDVQGARVVIAGSYLPGTTSSQDLAEINAIIDSVRIDPQG